LDRIIILIVIKGISRIVIPKFVHLIFYHFIGKADTKTVGIYYNLSRLESLDKFFNIYCLLREGFSFSDARNYFEVY
jgi:hypothetical protein